MEIAVIGAGPMGLAAAYQLTLDGHRPTIFEADDRLGGMTASFDFSGLQIERYYHFHCTSDHGLLQILDELDLADKMRWTETRMGYWHNNRLQDWGNPLALLMFKGLSLPAKVRYGLHAFLSTRRKDWRPLDHLEAGDWIRRWVGEEAWRVLWRTLFEYKFYNFADNLSAAWIWSRIHRIGNSRYSLMREKLGYLDGGSETLLQALSSAITGAGGSIRLATPVRQVAAENNRIRGIVLPDNSLLPFDRIISTVPLPFVPRLVPDLPETTLQMYRALNNIAVVCVIAKLRKPLSDKFWLNINDPQMDIPGLVEYTNLRPLDHAVVYVPFYLPGNHEKFQQDDSVFIQKVKNYLCRINPSLTEADIIDVRASRYRYAQPVCEPGFMERLPPCRSDIDGLWIADTSYYYPYDRGISESIEFGRKLAREAIA
ncbi:NAD(P)/FAD-dependent oxidoreductase [Pseudohongiella spirulinae]|uniref:Amine oxidase n=1 Tax=Pseudohongiella spirulinae TaxID=1249552 RepID=A0A0S2KFR9_9GAMM|nr:NAD(P)/FAD-dependent oxidoreductase [Pseudohongiella spirulinae]ALO47191.1 Amine oxidase [Pseudohongiella spirulinae]